MAAKRPTVPPAENIDDSSSEAPLAGDPGAQQDPQQPPEHRFFAWMRSLGIVRQPGWIGGVCAGLADRLGIDPLIIRGIVVVIAVLGGPALLLYAAGWLLLPDHKNRIQLELLLRGRPEAPLAGIGAMILLSMLPLTQGFWFAGSTFWGEPTWDLAWGRILWTVVVLGALVALVVVVARRAHAVPRVTPATTDDRPETIPHPIREEAAGSLGANPVIAEPVEPQGGPADEPPPPPAAVPADASAEELAAWREQQALWKQQNAEWKAQQAASARELRQRRAAQARERAIERAAEATERRRLRRLANPRIPAAVGWGALGAAIVVGGAAGLVATGDPRLADFEATVGLAAAAVTLGVAIVVAGALRRRTGILSFLAVLVVLALLFSALLPRTRYVLGTAGMLGAGDSASYAQLVGHLTVTVPETAPAGEVTDVWQGSGTVQIIVEEGAAARIEVVSRTSQVIVYDYVSPDEMDWKPAASQFFLDGMWQSADTVGDGGAPVVIRIWQGNGDIMIQDLNRPVDEEVAE